MECRFVWYNLREYGKVVYLIDHDVLRKHDHFNASPISFIPSLTQSNSLGFNKFRSTLEKLSF